ncbi:MAG: hypothetical protein HQL27_04310 [Candidatus Omnitrophica bacterium]|nr:hypothetical protein [Candidatus Omnitrophota bacterium]
MIKLISKISRCHCEPVRAKQSDSSRVILSVAKDLNRGLPRRFAPRNYILVFLFIFIASTKAFAAPAYGTKMPEKFKFFIGGQTHEVFERDLEGNNGEVKSTQHFLLLSFGLADWLSVDLKGGAGDIDQKVNNGLDLSYNTFVGGGYGFRIKVFEKDKLRSVVGFQHISIHPYTRNTGDTKHKGVLDDWQGSFLVSYDFEKITPYLGAKISRMDYIYWRDDIRNRVKSDTDKSIGAVAGFDLNLNDKTWLNVEGQFIDVKALSVSINYLF